MNSHLKVAVVGAGIHGASTARALSARGHKVTIFEQYHFGHDFGSSHGNSRIVRRAYPDAFYTKIMQDAYPLWHELELETGKKILYECGLLYFGPKTSEHIQSVAKSLESLQVPHEVLDRQGVRKVFPDLTIEDDEVGIFTPEAGWAHASLAIEATLELALRKGIQVRRQRVNDLADLKKEFDRVVLCQGPWASQFFDLPVVVTLQTFGYIAGEHYGPVWIEESNYSIYGFPSEPWDGGIKAGVHYKDIPYNPDDPARDATDGAIQLLKDFAYKRFQMDLPRIKRAKGCLYTNTANEDFLLGRVDEQIYFVSACSGHGFKFGPWIGRTMADLVEETKQPADFPRFNFEAKLKQ
jgi:monomeric sarcosine oxidase